MWVLSYDLSMDSVAPDSLQARVDALQAENARLRESNRRLGELARTLAHDMGSPIRTITGFAQAIAHRIGQDRPDMAGLVAPMERASRRIDQMIRDLYAYATMEVEGEAEPADANVVMRDVTEMLAGVESVPADVRWQDLPEVDVSYSQLRSVLLHLVDNALRHHASAAPPHIQVSAERDGEFWRFRVADNGNGIDPADREWALRPFGRLDRDSERGGMGLPMAQRIARMHDGDLWLEEAEEGGCAVCFTLPAPPRSA